MFVNMARYLWMELALLYVLTGFHRVNHSGWFLLLGLWAVCITYRGRMRVTEDLVRERRTSVWIVALGGLLGDIVAVWSLLSALRYLDTMCFLFAGLCVLHAVLQGRLHGPLLAGYRARSPRPGDLRA